MRVKKVSEFLPPVRLFFVLFFGALGAIGVMAQDAALADQVVSYDAPAGVKASDDYHVTVSGHPLFVYTAQTYQSAPASYASFDFKGSAEVTVEAALDLKSAQIRPASYGISPTVSGRKIQFTITKPGQLTVEINGTHAKALHLFANPLETDRPGANAPHVVYFGPGIHEVNTLELHDGTTLYLAGGAILRGTIRPDEPHSAKPDWAGQLNYQNFIHADGVKNIIICGRGIIDLTDLPWHSRQAIVLRKASNVTIEGITIIGAPCWTVALFDSRNIHIRNIKEICSRENSDGIDLCNSQDVLVEDCFLRNDDDEICVKTLEPPPAQMSKNILVQNCVIWNDRARGLGITSETRRDIRHVVFQNCDIIHDFSTASDCAALAVIVSDSATVSDIRFEDIRLEDVKANLILCWISDDVWSHDPRCGHIKGVTFNHIAVSSDVLPIAKFGGYDKDHLVEDVTFNRLMIRGRVIENIGQGKFFINPFVRNLRFTTNP